MDQEDYPALKSLLETQAAGIDLEQFVKCRNCSPGRISDLLEQLQRDNVAFIQLELGTTQIRLLHQRFLQHDEQAILNTLSRYHQAHQDQVGATEPTLIRQGNFQHPHPLFHALLEKLVDEGLIIRTGTLLHLPEHKVRLSPEEQEFLARIRPLLAEAGYVPPRTRELADLTGMKLGQLERTLAQARKKGHLVQVAANRHYPPETIARLALFTESLAQKHQQGFSVIQFRDELGIGRNLCIEILEYFDGIGLTLRRENLRLLRKPVSELFGATIQDDGDQS
jgi:selenocysteine-specific elongation factor